MLTETEEVYWQYVFPGNLVMLLAYAFYFVIQLVLQRNYHTIDRSRFSGTMIFYFLGPVFSVLSNVFYHPTVELSMGASVQMFNYHTLFFAQGLFVFTWREFLHADLEHMRQTVAYPLVVFSCLILYGVFLPNVHSELAFLMTYPIYMNFHLNCLHILGSWLVIYVLLWLFKSELNH